MNKLFKVIEKIIDDEKSTDINIVSTLVWAYQGATQEMELNEFISGLLDKRFTNQAEIKKIITKINHGRKYKNNIQVSSSSSKRERRIKG